jgi:hypothetical protein
LNAKELIRDYCQRYTNSITLTDSVVVEIEALYANLKVVVDSSTNKSRYYLKRYRILRQRYDKID